MKITILSSSLNKKSRSLILSQYAKKKITVQIPDCVLLDLKKFELPFCGEEGAYSHENVTKIKNDLEESDAIIVSGPVYNYGVNAVTKNILDLTGEAWAEKPIGFICVAGGQASYMSIMGFANSLMLNFHSIIVPRFVYALPASVNVENQALADDSIKKRIDELCDSIIRLARALKE